MGIKGLSKFLGDCAPRSLKQIDIKSLKGRIVAIDASMALYQFLIAIRDGDQFANLENAAGEATSHIAGMLNRAIRLMECGIKPLFVFDGKPPTLKGGELAKRKQKRMDAEKEYALAEETGDRENMKKQIGRTVKVTSKHTDDVKYLLKLLGFPIVEAPCEAEAQCAELTKGGKVYATATEDADALTFGSTILLRYLNVADNKGRGPSTLAITLNVALEELNLTMPQFVDFCILCGCDYCDTIRGIGAKTAYALIKEKLNLEEILASLDKEKHLMPSYFPYEEARQFFLHPDVISASEFPVFKWKDADEEGLKKFLISDNNFSELRVENLLKRVRKAKQSTSQTRLEAFFGPPSVKSSSLAPTPTPSLPLKRTASHDSKKLKKAKKLPSTHSSIAPLPSEENSTDV